MKIEILYDVWEGMEAYPGEADEPQGRSRRRPPKLDRDEIFSALEQLGHEPSFRELDGTPRSLAALTKSKPDLVFNLVESFGGDDTKEMHVAALLDLLGIPYTGSGPHALHLAQDKGLAKKIFEFHGIRTPSFAVSFRGQLDHAHELEFPLIVKPSSEDGSIGIDSGSVVHSVRELMERVAFVGGEFDTPVLIEQYIEGREIYAAILGNDKPESLPLVELDLSKLPDDMPKIAGHEVKFERGTEAYRLTSSRVADDLDEETAERLRETAIAAWRALRLRDYGRIDMRLGGDGSVWVIEANPNPWLASKAEFAMAAKASGRSYGALISEIVGHALARTNLARPSP
jgi:D-alanine-D-alanine ligase